MPLLIVESNPPLAIFLKNCCGGSSTAVDLADSGDRALTLAHSLNYDLILFSLDPPQCALSDLRILASLNPRPWIIAALPSPSTINDRIECWDHGADDVVCKPLSVPELSARIRALSRRSAPVDVTLRIADLEVDRFSRIVTRAGQRISLTTKEYELVEYLVLNADKPVTRRMILESVWGTKYDPCTNVVDVYVNYIRRKIDTGHAQRLIHTLRGTGYLLSARADAPVVSFAAVPVRVQREVSGGLQSRA
jgi:two-component system, OmpR family, copper resistance phosphate regulon response regulator CusR